MNREPLSASSGSFGGSITTTDHGIQYFVIGKTRIKITEHFPENGKSIDELIDGLIQQKIREKVRKMM